MIKILFVCHGNICRSPMAEFIMKDLTEKAGYSVAKKQDDRADFYIASASTSKEELGNPVYPPARRKLEDHWLDCSGKRAKQMKKRDYIDYDLLIGMDRANISNMKEIAGGDPDGKMHLLLEYTGRGEEVADPWYTRDFETTYDQILEGCEALLGYLKGSDVLRS